MYLIYKGKEYFGVCYESISMALYVCSVFSKTLGKAFNIKWTPSSDLLLAVND